MKLFLFFSFTTVCKVILQELTSPMVIVRAPVSLIVIGGAWPDTNDTISDQRRVALDDSSKCG